MFFVKSTFRANLGKLKLYELSNVIYVKNFSKSLETYCVLSQIISKLITDLHSKLFWLEGESRNILLMILTEDFDCLIKREKDSS